MSLERNPDISESALKPKFIVFLTAAKEKYPEFTAEGICNALAAAMLRACATQAKKADAEGKAEVKEIVANEAKAKYIRRLQDIATMSDEELKRLGEMFGQYKSQDKKIQPDKEKDLIKARDIHVFLHMLLAMFDPDTQLQLRDSEGQPILQAHFVEILKLVPTDEMQKAYMESKIFPIKQELAFDWDFSEKSLAYFLENHAKDNRHVMIKSSQHTIYVSKEKGQYKIYNSIYKKGEGIENGFKTFTNCEDLAKEIIKYSFKPESIENEGEPVTIFPFGIRILKEVDAEIDKKEEKSDSLSIDKILDELLNKFPEEHTNTQGVDGITPLICATTNGNVEMVNILLDKKALPSIRDFLGESPAMIAAEVGSVKILEELEKKGSIDLNNSTAKAAQHGRLNVLILLAERKATFDEYNKRFDKNAIMLAAKANHWDCVAYMLMRIDAKNNKIHEDDYSFLLTHRKKIAEGYEQVYMEKDKKSVSEEFKEKILKEQSLLGKLLETGSFPGLRFSRYKIKIDDKDQRVTKTVYDLNKKFGKS